MPFSVKFTVMVLTVRSDLPICAAISFCVALGCSLKKFSTAISSKVQFKVQILHFGRFPLLYLHFERLAQKILAQALLGSLVRYVRKE